MTWKTPKIVEIAVGLEINMYACAVRKLRTGTEPLRRATILERGEAVRW